MLRRVLTEHDENLLRKERELVASLREPLTLLDASAADHQILDRAQMQLDDLFLLVVVGEFNAGKSAFINALLGSRLLAEGVTPTTTQINILRYGEGGTRAEGEEIIHALPVAWLQDISIVDTPGTNAVIERHQQITERFVPRADLVLFVTSADRPFSHSERVFLQGVRDWGKKVVIVINKIDIVEEGSDLGQIEQFVSENATPLLGTQPLVFPVSSRLARQGKESSDPAERESLWAHSRFAPLEQYILHTLDERERLRLKLLNPLGVAERLVSQYSDAAASRRSLLGEDLRTMATIEGQLAGYEADLRRNFKYHLSHVENVLLSMSDRGNRFFDETIRIGRILDLVNAERIRGMFEREVIADTVAKVDAHTDELIDWVVEADFKQWQSIMEYLNRRISVHQEQIVGEAGTGFELSRRRLLESVGRAAQQAVATYDHSAEARQLAESVQMAVAQTAIVEVGAIGLGAVLVKLLATALADVSGVLAAGVVAALGFYVIPNKRRRAKNELQAKIAELRERLTGAITSEFERELERSLQRIREAVRPYTRFVEAQQRMLDQSEATLLAAQRGIAELQSEIASSDNVAVG